MAGVTAQIRTAMVCCLSDVSVCMCYTHAGSSTWVTTAPCNDPGLGQRAWKVPGRKRPGVLVNGS